MTSLRTTLGIARSLLMYYGIPGRARRFRRFYESCVRPGDLCFDIGAHLGNHTRAWLKLGARVVAAEPHPDFMRLLRRWYGNRPAVTLVEAAVGAEWGRQLLRISRRHPTVNTLSADWISAVVRDESFAPVRWDETRTVAVTTLDALIEQFGEPAYCKIDVEGYELAALDGLSRPIRAVSFEFVLAAREIALACIERLESLGHYRYNWTVREEMHLREPDWLDAGQMVQRLEAMPAGSKSGDVIAQRL